MFSSRIQKCSVVMAFFGWTIGLAFMWTVQSAWAQADIQDKIDAHVQPYLDNKIVVGLSVGLLKDGQSQVFGYGRVGGEAKETPDERTLYEIGSITKVFTSILLADRVHRAVMSLDDSISQWIPGGFPKPHSTLSAIQLKHLATHESGLPRMPSNFDPADADNPFRDYEQKQLYDFLHKHLLMHKPGEHWEYSNLAFGLLGDVLASHHETSYESLLAERITKPLEMSDTVLTLNSDQQSRLAHGSNEGSQPVQNWDFASLAGAGAIRSTVEDMLKFAAVCLSRPDNDLGRAIELTWNEQRKAKKPGEHAGGLGWLIARDGQTRFHNGQTGGYHSALFVGPDLNQAVVVLSNTATAEVSALAENLYQVLAGMDVQPRVFDKTFDVAPEKMLRYVGKYELIPNMMFTVSVEDDKLLVGLTGQSTYRVYPRSETEWFYKVVEATLTFQVDEEGKCNELEIFQNGRRQTAKRVD